MNVYEFARRYLEPYTIKGNEIIPKHCPYCQGGQHRDKETFALNIDKQTFNCKRGTCGKTGTFYQLCKDFGEEADKVSYYGTIGSTKQYKKPETKIKTITNRAEAYLQKRKISKATIEAFQIGCDDKDNIIFPFFNDKGELEFIKFRPSHKVGKGERKAWREADTKPILFGMNLCNPEYPLCIFEGEIDSMSGHEAGIHNCVSVPSGTEDMTWIDTCFDWLKQFNTIYLFGDNDEPGREMTGKLKTKLSNHRLYIVEHKYKDANELLYREGEEAVRKAYEEAKEVPVYGLIDLSDVKALDIKKIPSVKSGIKELDAKLGGFLMGDLSIWTGKRGEGKSTFLGQIMLESINNGYKVCVYSGELRAERFQYWVNLQAAGKENIKSYYDIDKGREVFYIDKSIDEKIRTWYKGKFWLYDNSIAESSEETSILKIFEYAAKRYDCKVFFIDNLMTAKYNADTESNYYRAQSNFVGQLVEFANKYNVHVHLVAHPRKTSNSLDNDDISGTADITNRAANVFSLEKLKDEDRTKQGYDVLLSILKNRWEGYTGKFGLNYCHTSRRLYAPSVGNKRIYGWQKLGKQFDWVEEIADKDSLF